MRDMLKRGAIFYSCGGQLLNQNDCGLVFLIIREILKNFGGPWVPDPPMHKVPYDNNHLELSRRDLKNVGSIKNKSFEWMPVPTKYIYKENEREVDVMPNLAN